MRTSGGADASCRRLRDATPGPLHPLTILLLTLAILCPVVAAEAAPASPQWRQLESHVTVGADGIAMSRGAGRQRSDGLSITRSTPVDTGNAPDAVVDDQAIKFTPPRVELGRMETCSPQRYYVGVENRGRVSVRLDGADFTHSGFSLATDVRGIRLDPGDRFNLQFVFLPSEVEPNGVDAHLRVLTTSGLFALPISSPEVALNRYGVSAIKASIPAGVRFGQSLQFVNPVDYTIRITEVYALDSFVHIELLNGSNWIGPRWPRKDDEKEVREVPGEYDKEFDYARRTDRGAWDMPAGTTSPLMKVSLLLSTPGVYFTHIHIAAGEQRLLLVPVHITVLKPGIHIEPKELDLGVLTDLHEDEPREVFFTLYNAGVNPIDVLELKVLESNLIVSAQLWGGTSVIPPRTQVYSALAVQLRVDRAKESGNCFASLLLKTNASSSELGQRKLKLYGQVVRGSMTFQLNETRAGVVYPLQKLFYKDEGARGNDTAEHNGKEPAVDDEETSTTKLVSMVGENASMGIMAGTSAFQKLRLWNRFDRPMELQRVWIDYPRSNQDGSQEVAVYKFKQSVAPAGSAWPKISLQISPALRGKGHPLATKSYPLVIETNVTRHRIPIYVYHGFLAVDSSRGLQNYSESGYYVSNSSEIQPLRSCVKVPEDGFVPTTSPRIDGGDRIADTHAVKLCRSMLFDLEKVASHNSRTEVVEITNENPIPVTLTVISVPVNDTVDLSIHDVHSVVERLAGYREDQPSSNDSDVVVVGDTVVLRPRHQLVFHVKVQAKDTLGELTVPVMSIATPTEVVHFHARLQSVRGTVEPITPAIVLPSMFPGRTQVIHLKYRNTFEHPVTPLMATTSSSNLKLLSIRNAIAPKQIENVLDLLFSPAADSKCSGALFLADCLLPTMEDQTSEQLSGYGELVHGNDLIALSRRNAFWSDALGDDHLSTVETRVHLQTDIMDDVAEVTVKALLERPLVTAPSDAQSRSRNDSSMVFERKEFALTELLHLSHIFVRVRNPSNVSIYMELTHAEADEPLFYSCEDGLDHVHDITEGDATTEISALCLDEWMAAASNSVALQREVQVDLNIPPFYFRKRIIQVGAGEEAQLGPIYYLPSKVQEVTTVVFVRNSLSHIEPVPLLARSGKGTLELVVDAADSISDKTRYTPRRLVAETGGSDDLLDFEGTLRFDLTQQDELTDYTQHVEILLSNTGPFGLTILNVMLDGEAGISWLPSIWASKTASAANDFEVSSKYLQSAMSREDTFVVLQPGKSVRLQVSFRASCYVTNVASWLVVDTSDSLKRIRLEGTITTEAAFSCLRSRMSPSIRYALRSVWMLAVIIAVFSTLYTLWALARDAWTSDTIREASFTVGTGDPCKVSSDELAAALNMGDERDEKHQTLESINRLLEGMEKAAFAPTVRVVTPAVTALLERRHKGVCSIVQKDPTSEIPGVLKVTNESKCAQDNAASPPAVANDGTQGDKLLVKTERVSASDVASTVTEARLQDAQEEAVDEGDATDISALLVSTEPVSEPNITLSKLLDGNDDHKTNDLSSEDSSSSVSSEDGSIASSHSTIIPPESEESTLSADFPKLMFGSPNGGDQLKPAPLGLDKAAPKFNGTPSPQKEEGPFEAFKSVSERWRTQDWPDNFTDPSPPSLSPKFPTLEDWNGSLSFNTLGQGLVAGNQRDESLSSGSRSESSSFIGTSSGLYLDSFSAFGGSVAAPTPLPIATTTKAPPGFTPADAKPLETRAAFERLRSGSGSGSGNASSAAMTSNPNDAFGHSSVFASNLPLFGPALPPTNYNNHRGAGRIGSRTSKGLHAADSPQKTSAGIGNKHTGY